jgi:glycosyltransferase involved in cell wall biosynthesis
MKLLVVHNRYRTSSPSGEDRVVDQECEALLAAGHDVRRFERFSDDIAGFSLPRKAQLPVRLLWNRQAARDLGTVLETFHPDAVHFHNTFPLLSPSVLRLCERKRVPSVVTLHNYWQVCGGCNLFRTGAECRDCVGRRLPLPGVQHGCYRNSTLATLPVAVATVAHRRIWQTVPEAYIFLSQAQQRELAPVGFPPSRCFVKPNLTPPTPRRTTPEDLVVYLGRLSEPKGLRVLMRAWDRYIGAGPSPGLRLAIAGTGPLEAQIRAWAGSRPSVDMLGFVDREQCASLVRRATTVVVPSEWLEPFGLVVVEAMAAGVAPIATTQGAFPELITDGVDGLLYPPSDDGALATLLAQIEASPQWMAKLGTSARRTYEGRFAPARIVTELEAIYRFAIDNPRWLDDQAQPAKAERTTETMFDPAPR